VLTNTSDDVNTAFGRYNSTLTDLFDTHSPLKLQRISSRQSDRCYDNECRDIKRKKYRRLLTDESLADWRCQFRHQRPVYQSKFTSFWSSTINGFERNLWALWRAVNGMLQPSPQRTGRYEPMTSPHSFKVKLKIFHFLRSRH